MADSVYLVQSSKSQTETKGAAGGKAAFSDRESTDGSSFGFRDLSRRNTGKLLTRNHDFIHGLQKYSKTGSRGLWPVPLGVQLSGGRTGLGPLSKAVLPFLLFQQFKMGVRQDASQGAEDPQCLSGRRAEVTETNSCTLESAERGGAAALTWLRDSGSWKSR